MRRNCLHRTVILKQKEILFFFKENLTYGTPGLTHIVLIMLQMHSDEVRYKFLMFMLLIPPKTKPNV